MITKIRAKNLLPMVILIMLIFSISLSAKAVLEFKEKTVDFGEAESGKVIDVEFEFTNTGDELLIIKNISTSCGCTAAKLDKREYQPDEKGVIKVKFFTQGYSGKVVKTVTVSSNDKDKIYSRLKVQGILKLTNFAQAELDANKLDFEETKLGETYTKSLTLKNTGTINLLVVELIHGPEIVPVFVQKEIAADQETEIKIEFRPMKAGKFNSFLKIRTNAYRQRLLIVRISARITDQ